jgi:hypothetical protein
MVAAAYAAGLVLAMVRTDMPTAGAYARGLHAVQLAHHWSRSAIPSGNR